MGIALARAVAQSLLIDPPRRSLNVLLIVKRTRFLRRPSSPGFVLFCVAQLPYFGPLSVFSAIGLMFILMVALLRNTREGGLGRDGKEGKG